MSEGDRLQMPFDAYDFFGYLASGLLVIVGMEATLGFPQVLGRDFKAVDYAILALATYVAGQIIATPAKAFLEDIVVDKLLGRPSVNLLRDKGPTMARLIFPGFYKPLPDNRRKRIREKVNAEGGTATGEALFLHIRYSPAVRGNEALLTRLNSFLNKYGFARNLAFTSLVLSVALFLRAAIYPNPPLLKYAIVAAVSGIALFYRYLKFFRQYSYELFNTYAAD
jgi:hypothetical protein